MSLGKIHQQSKDTVSSALDLFDVPPTNTSVLEGTTVTIGPVRNPDGALVDFQYRTDGFTHLDGRNSYFHIQARVKMAAGGNMTNTLNGTKVMAVNNFLHSLFQSCEVAFGGHLVSYDGNYPYTAYQENLLSYGRDFKRTVGKSFMWVEDDTGVKDVTQITDDNKDDVEARKKLIQGSKVVDMVGPLNIPILRQERFLLPDTEINIRLQRSDPKFCLVRTEAGTDDYKIEIEKCDLKLRLLKVHPSITNAHNSLLSSGHTAKYPINKVVTQMFTIAAGTQSERINVILNQQRPKRLFFAFMDHDARNGHLDKDPFNFKHFNLTSIVLDVDGQPLPSKPIKMNFASDTYSEIFYQLAQTTGRSLIDGDLGITREQFANGYAIFAFDLTSDLCEGSGVHLIKNSTVTLELTFSQDLPHTISLFMYAEKDELFEIDQERALHRLSRI